MPWKLWWIGVTVADYLFQQLEEDLAPRLRGGIESFWELHSNSLITWIVNRSCHSLVLPSLILKQGGILRAEMGIVDIAKLKQDLRVL